MAQFRSDLLSLDGSTDSRMEVVMLGNQRGGVAEFRPTFTQKNRLRVSNITTNFFSTFQYDKSPSAWDEAVVGTGVGEWDPDGRHVHLGVFETGDEVIRQTRNVMRYTPSRGTQISIALNFKGHVPGLRKRAGIFDENNGVFFESDGTELWAVIRSSVSGTPVERRVRQSDWNRDKLNGVGSSKATLDLSKVQMIVLDYEWYGAGQVNVGFVIENYYIVVHEFYHGNMFDSTWSATPFLPIRLELTNVSAGSGTWYMEQYSASQVEEGEAMDQGISRNVITPLEGKTLSVADTWYPVISIRIQSDKLNSVVIPTYFAIATSDNTLLHYRLTRNATLTGAVWTPHSIADSVVEYDTSATGVSGGTAINSGFVPGGTNPGAMELNGHATYQLGRTNMGTASDIWTLQVASSVGNKTAHGTINWVEQR